MMIMMIILIHLPCRRQRWGQDEYQSGIPHAREQRAAYQGTRP